MAVAFVQGTGTNTAGSTAASISKAFDSNVTAGNCLVVAVMTDSGRAQGNASGWSSSPSNSFAYGSSDQLNATSHVNVSFVVSAASGATTITFTPTSSDWMAMGIAEFSGVDGNPFDGRSGNTNNTANPTAGAISTTTAGVVLGVMGRHASGTITPGTGWTQIFEDENWDDTTISFIYQITSASGSYNASWTASAASWWAAAVALKEGAGGPPPMNPALLGKQTTILRKRTLQ